MKKFCVCLLAPVFLQPSHVYADIIEDAKLALGVAGEVCSGIGDDISSVSGIARVNTAVTAVGVAAGGGALYAGIKKQQIDKEIEELEKKICNAGGCDANSVEKMTDEQFFYNVMMPAAEIARLMELEEKSKRAGNWRTGLLAGAGATHIASAIMSGIKADQSELTQRVIACNNAIDELRIIKNDMAAQGVNPFENPVRSNIERAISECERINVDDVAKIETREKWVMGSSIAGGAAATAGVITSASANSSGVRNDNSDAGRKKEKNLNTVSNVLAGVSTVGSGVATGFNISLITLTRKMMQTADNCAEALK